MAEVSGYSLLTMSEIRICNPICAKFLARIFQRVFAMKLIAEWVCQKSVVVTEKFEKVGCMGRGPDGAPDANDSQHRIRHR